MTVKILSLLLVGAFVFTVRGNDEATTPAAEVVVEEFAAGQQQQSPVVEAIMEQHRHPSVDEVSATTAACETYSPTKTTERGTSESGEYEVEKELEGLVVCVSLERIYYHFY
ncbi:unnamed protein product [Gongylonema pulchrum]|uniref:Secreted protein n=1 Tax=Gongylonema pulchrum TaxID=637853 RepID=A0A183E366_9BILA|nr:unnamed protein product [Gongylonema pulchrum]